MYFSVLYSWIPFLLVLSTSSWEVRWNKNRGREGNLDKLLLTWPTFESRDDERINESPLLSGYRWNSPFFSNPSHVSSQRYKNVSIQKWRGWRGWLGEREGTSGGGTRSWVESGKTPISLFILFVLTRKYWPWQHSTETKEARPLTLSTNFYRKKTTLSSLDTSLTDDLWRTGRELWSRHIKNWTGKNMDGNRGEGDGRTMTTPGVEETFCIKKNFHWSPTKRTPVHCRPGVLKSVNWSVTSLHVKWVSDDLKESTPKPHLETWETTSG